MLHIGGVALRIEERWDVSSASTRRLAFELVEIATVPEIVVVEGAAADVERKLRLVEDREYVIGRASRCDLPLEDVTMSREHLVVRRTGGHVVVRDCGTSRGTFLGTTPLYARRNAVWPAEHMIGVGRTVLALRLPVDQDKLLAQVREETTAATPRCGDLPQSTPDAAPPSSAGHNGSRLGAPIATIEPRIVAPPPRPRRVLEFAFVLAILLIALATAGLLVYILAVA
jgi:hypothetical protein